MTFLVQNKRNYHVLACMLLALSGTGLAWAEIATCPNPPGGSVTCEPGQVAKCAVSAQGVLGRCRTPPKNLSGAALKSWVIKEVTGKEVPTAQAASAEYNHIFTSGQWQSGGTKVSFSLPKSFEEATYSKLSASDAHFVKQAAKAGMEEVELGKLAAQKASDPDVKSIAQRIVDDHLKANDQLKQLAAQKGVTLSTDLSVSRTDKAAKLSKLSGTAFDRAYISTVVKGQKKLVADFANTSKTGKDSDIKSFAATILPDLQDHLKMVQGFFRTSSKASKKKSNSDS